jgi:hypothetical protein
MPFTPFDPWDTVMHLHCKKSSLLVLYEILYDLIVHIILNFCVECFILDWSMC